MSRYDDEALAGERQFYDYISTDDRFQNVQWANSGGTTNYDIYDFQWQTNGKKFYGEVKNRNFTSTSALAQQGLYFEGQKAFNLLPLYYSGGEIRYVNVFNDGHIYIWDASAIIGKPLVWTTMNYHHADEDKSYKVTKGVFMMDINNAVKLK